MLLREGLARILADAGHEIVRQVDNGPDLVEAIVALNPDISIVDVRMPPTHRDEGLRAAIEARRQVPGTAILIFSQYVEERYASELLETGAEGVGYLLKDRVADVRDFLISVRQVAERGTVLDPEVISQILARHRKDNRLTELTSRERDVLSLMAEGRSNSAIADYLSISDGTVEKHISNIFGKLGLDESSSQHRRVLAVLTYLQA
ncbi:MAG TPA: response regulator transcription factor [Nitrolancea sp.]